MEIQTKGFKWGFFDGKLYLWVEAPDSMKDVIQEFILGLDNDKTYDVSVKPRRKKRSLDSNSYYWVLAGKLSAKLKIPPVEIYRQHIQDIGDNYEIIPIKDDAVEKFSQAWGHNGIGWVTNVIGKSKLPGYTNIMAYYGSSTYDSSSMSALLDLMISDCKEQGIDTITPGEKERLMEQWGAK